MLGDRWTVFRRLLEKYHHRQTNTKHSKKGLAIPDLIKMDISNHFKKQGVTEKPNK
jgi:hypothetical protein